MPATTQRTMNLRALLKPLTWLMLALPFVAIQAHAAQVLDVHVDRNGPHFVIDMHITIDASPRAVFQALQDYSAMERYNPDLRAVRVEPTAVPDRVRLFTTIHACVLIFCKMMHQEQIMTARGSAQGGVLNAVFVAHAGDFKEGNAQWTVAACPTARARSCMDAEIELTPAFWVPPVIGPWVIRGMMEQEAERTSVGLERMASGGG